MRSLRFRIGHVKYDNARYRLRVKKLLSKSKKRTLSKSQKVINAARTSGAVASETSV